MAAEIIAQGIGADLITLEDQLVTQEQELEPGTRLQMDLVFNFVPVIDLINSVISFIGINTSALGLMAFGIERIAGLAGIIPWPNRATITEIEQPNILRARWVKGAVFMPVLLKWLLNPTVLGIALGFTAALIVSQWTLLRQITVFDLRLIVIAATSIVIVPPMIRFLSRANEPP